MKRRTTVSLLGSIALVILVVVTPAHASQMRRVPIGHAVAHSSEWTGTVDSWAPLDLNNDGVWELVLTLDDPTANVGVYSPSDGTWLDGPRALPVTGRQWGVGDYDGDGRLEYAYKSSDAIRLYDPDTDSDSLLWNVPPERDGGAIFWGETNDGRPLVGVVASHSSDHTETYGTVTTTEWSEASVYDLLSGELVSELPAGTSQWHFIYGYDQGEGTRLVIDRQETSQGCGTMNSTTSWLYRFSVLDQDWAVHKEYHHDYFNNVGCYILVVPHITAVACAPDPAGNEARLLTDLAYYPLGSGTLYGHGIEQTNPQWVKGVTDRQYAGAAAFDLDANGTVSWILPTADTAGWEIRNLETGVVTDTIPDMPAEDLHTGPLFEAGIPDLFYFADSGLYIWGLTTDVSDDETSPAPVPRNLTLTAYPNPFNANVTLTWDDGSGATRLDILNILGQRVRTYDLDNAATLNAIEWNGRDQNSASVPTGVYFARLIAPNRTAITKIVLLK